MDLATDAFEDVPAVVAFLFEEVPDVADRRGLDRRGPDDLRRPPNFLGDLPERRAVAADYHPRLLGLDDHLASIFVEIQIRDAGLIRDDRQDLVTRLPGRGEHVRVRADGDPLAEFRRKPTNEVAVLREGLGIARVNDQFRPLVGDIRDRNVVGYFANNRLFRILELLIYVTHSCKMPPSSPEGGPRCSKQTGGDQAGGNDDD